MQTTRGAASRTRLRRKEQLKEAKKYGQILPAAEVIMKNEKNKRSLAHNKTQKERAAEASKEIRTDPSSSGGHYEI